MSRRPVNLWLPVFDSLMSAVRGAGWLRQDSQDMVVGVMKMMKTAAMMAILTGLRWEAELGRPRCPWWPHVDVMQPAAAAFFPRFVVAS